MIEQTFSIKQTFEQTFRTGSAGNIRIRTERGKYPASLSFASFYCAFVDRHGDGFQSAVLVWNFELVTSGHGVTV